MTDNWVLFHYKGDSAAYNKILTFEDDFNHTINVFKNRDLEIDCRKEYLAEFLLTQIFSESTKFLITSLDMIQKVKKLSLENIKFRDNDSNTFCKPDLIDSLLKDYKYGRGKYLIQQPYNQLIYKIEFDKNQNIDLENINEECFFSLIM